MNLQKTTQYALTVLSYMTFHEKEMLSADQISRQTKIPQRYLRRLMTELSNAGFLRVTRGRNGGFAFARDVNGITLYEIIHRFEQESIQSQCILGFTFCALDTPCLMHNEWAEANDRIVAVLKSTTLGALRERHISQLTGWQTG